MAQVHSPAASMLDRPDDGGVVRVARGDRPAGVARLLGVRPDDPAVARFLETARVERTDLSLLWGAPAMGPGPDLFDEVCLVVPGTGRTGMLFVSASAEAAAAGPPRAGVGARVVGAAVGFLKTGCDTAGALPPHAQDLVLAQALLEPEQTIAARSLEGGGFTRLAELAYLKRDLPRRAAGPQPVWPLGVSVVPQSRLGASGERLVAQGMACSYEGTLDCPDLCGLRSVEDVLESHRAVGVLDPRLWFVVMHKGETLGCMLLSPVPVSETVELVYLGLGPALRGQGLGRELLKFALAVLAGRPQRTLACAVDTKNTPALALYESLRFRPFTRRVALVHALRPPARAR